MTQLIQMNKNLSITVNKRKCKHCDEMKDVDDMLYDECIECEPSIASELTHIECNGCHELKREFAEIAIQHKSVIMCKECCTKYEDEGPEFFYKDPE